MFVETPITGTKKQYKPVYGAGINDATYHVRYTDNQGIRHSCPYYAIWMGILKRCLCPMTALDRPTYAGCTIEESWKTFSIFKAWMCKQNWQNKQLDKDLLVPGNKHYGPNTCLFLTQALNSLLCLRTNDRGAWPLGVYLDKRKPINPFVARCRMYGKSVHLGTFDSPEKASACYIQAKLAYIAELADAESDPQIKQALLNLY